MGMVKNGCMNEDFGHHWPTPSPERGDPASTGGFKGELGMMPPGGPDKPAAVKPNPSLVGGERSGV